MPSVEVDSQVMALLVLVFIGKPFQYKVPEELYNEFVVVAGLLELKIIPNWLYQG